MTAIEVTAIMPVYNAEKTLKRAIKSLLIQPEITQIILVEDGSTDSSLELCRQLALQHSHITLLQHPDGANKGAPASRNLGMTQARHTWIQFMDADDELLPGKIADQVAVVNGEVGLIVGKYTLCGKNRREVNAMGDVWAGLIATRIGDTIANLWNRDWISAVGGWNENLYNMQEYHLMFELFKKNVPVSYSKKNLTKVYPQPNSISNTAKNVRRNWDTYFSFRSAIRQYLIETGTFTLKRRHYYQVCTGEMLRYHRPGFQVPFNKPYYTIYRSLKSLKR